MWFWAIYRIATLIIVSLVPTAATALTALVQGVDAAAMCNVIAYTVNSSSERAILGYFGAKTGTMNAAFKAMSGGTMDDEDEQDDNENEDGGSNG